MKIFKICNLTLLAMMMLGLSSCVNDWLDESPSDGVDADKAITSSESLGSARTGLYAALKGNSSNTDYYAANFFAYAEAHGEDIQYNNVSGSNRGSFYYYMNYAGANEFTSTGAVWKSPYIVISRASRMIEAAESGKLTDQSEAASTISQYENEAKALRGLALFDLVRIYGKPYTEDQGASLGVPVVTTSLQSTDKMSRNKVSECYNQILKDLNDAINSKALSTANTKGYIDVWGAKAILSRVYMTMGNFGDALTVSEDIINNSPYKLWTKDQYVSAWDKNDANHTNEIMLEMSITNSTDWTDRPGVAYLYAESGGINPGYGDLIATKTFVDMLSADPNDVRNGVFLSANAPKDVAAFGKNKIFLNKMPAVNGDVRYSNVPLIRLSEIYLNAAEAAFNAGDKDKAALYLNDIISNRTSDNTKLVSASTITADRIYIERRKELVGEGHRFFDALRRNETITRYTNDADRGWHDVLPAASKSYNRDYFKALSAIPQYEMNANSNMVQNPGYGN